ncbi:MAG: hypothetical protein ACRDKY_09750, partial [Solirubrobacteraceae bacterium]
ADARCGVAQLSPDAVAEARIVQTWLAGRELDVPALELDPPPAAEQVGRFVEGSAAAFSR